MPATVAEAVAELAAHPDWLVVAGGTDLVPALSAGRTDPPGIIGLTWLREITGWTRLDGAVRVGAGLTCARSGELTPLLPALATAAACVGGAAVRYAATVGGNLISARGGDLLPVLVAAEAIVELAAASGSRESAVAEFLAPAASGSGPDLRDGELLTGVRVPTPRGGAQYARIGLRAAGAPALVTVAVVADADAGTVRVAVGAGGPVPVRVPDAEAVLAAEPGGGIHQPPSAAAVAEFTRRVATAAGHSGAPEGAGAGQRAYRAHAAGVCAARLLGRLVGDEAAR